MIDIKHFLTPLKSKTTLIIILVVALVFGIYRASYTSQSVGVEILPRSTNVDQFYRELENLIKK